MDPKYVYGTSENRYFSSLQVDTMLQFGRQFPSPGGSSYYLSDDGTPWKERPRETWITSRMVHSYALGSLLGKENCEQMIDAPIRGLLGELYDKENDGWYAGLTSSGDILPGKHCYAHAFVILAGCSGVISGRPDAQILLDKSLAVYNKYFWDEEAGLSCDTWNTDFTVCDTYRGLNANMHSVEAFLAVADVTGNETYRVRAGRIIDHVIGWAKANNWRIPEHYTTDWEPDLYFNIDKPNDQFKPFGATPGHGIEWSRLITQWAVSTYKDDSKRIPYLDAAVNLYHRAISDGWNTDGAPDIVYTTDWEGKPIVHDRMHWVIAEAINTSATLFQVTGDRLYADNYAHFMQYVDEKVIDHTYNSWFHQLDCHNKVLNTVWPGKPDIYHDLQAMLIPYYPVGISIAAAIGK